MPSAEGDGMEITMKKRQTAIICMIISLLTACAFSPADADVAEPSDVHGRYERTGIYSGFGQQLWRMDTNVLESKVMLQGEIESMKVFL